MKTKIYTLLFLICNLLFANATKNALPPNTIFYASSPACVSEGNIMEVSFVEDPVAIDPGDLDLDPSGGTFSSTAGLVIDPVTGQIDAGASLPGTYIVKYTNNIVFYKTTVKLISKVMPTFNPIGLVCQGGTAPVLPTASTNAIIGTWSPRVVSTASLGSTEYFFTPRADQCADPTSITVNISNTLVVPTFNRITTTYCLNDQAQNLPTTSANGIDGTWYPATINTAIAGTVNYTFTANTGVCISSPVVTVIVNEIKTPDFYDISLNTNFQAIPALPTTSPNGIMGTWSPAVIDLSVSSIYTFTPSDNQCAIQKVISVISNYPRANTPPPLQVCGSFFSGSFYLKDNDAFINTNVNPSLYKVEYFQYQYQAQSTSNIYTKLPDNYTTSNSEVTIYARVINISSPQFFSVVPVILKAQNNGLQVSISTPNNLYEVYVDANGNVVQPITITGNLQGNVRCVWTRDTTVVGDSPSNSFTINTFTGLNTPRAYKLTVYNTSSSTCTGVSNSLIITQKRVPAPAGNTTQTYTTGQTLQNLLVTGSNIRWYSSMVPSANTLLPSTTLLTNGTIYYATQTIGGAESPTVLGVTSVLNTLSNAEFNKINFKFGPNPIDNELTIQSEEIIKTISILNMLGQEVFSKKINNSEMTLELSNLLSGNYFAKIESENKVQVFKIIKK